MGSVSLHRKRLSAAAKVNDGIGGVCKGLPVRGRAGPCRQEKAWEWRLSAPSPDKQTDWLLLRLLSSSPAHLCQRRSGPSNGLENMEDIGSISQLTRVIRATYRVPARTRAGRGRRHSASSEMSGECLGSKGSKPEGPGGSATSGHRVPSQTGGSERPQQSYGGLLQCAGAPYV